jgi:hypothetical protein
LFKNNLPQNFIVKYQDEEKDLITLSTDTEYLQALQEAAASQSSPNLLRLFIVSPKDPGNF